MTPEEEAASFRSVVAGMGIDEAQTFMLTMIEMIGRVHDKCVAVGLPDEVSNEIVLHLFRMATTPPAQE